MGGGGQDPHLQATWFFNDVEMAHIDAGGVLDLKKDYQERASQGQLQLSKLSPKSFSLKIFSMGPEDEGTYRCVVAEVTRAQMGSWQVLQKKQSPDSFVRLWKQAGMWSRGQTWLGCISMSSFVSIGYFHGHRAGLLKSGINQVTLRWSGVKGSTQTSWKPGGFPGGLVGKESVCHAGNPGDSGSIPGLGRSPIRGNGKPL